MNTIILCSPSVSEGRNKEIIDALAGSITSTDGVILLDMDSSPIYNRTLFNFVGPTDLVLEAALQLARSVHALIDMSRHKTGYQPKLGSMSFCPFVPIHNEDLDECVSVAQRFAEKLAEDLFVPVYLYGNGVATENSTKIQSLFMTDYESLEQKLQEAENAPDFGPAEFCPMWGATLVGARKFLVYYNVNLLGTKEQANQIASELQQEYQKKMEERQKQQQQETPGNKKAIVTTSSSAKTAAASSVCTTGNSEILQSGGWFSEDFNVAQVTTSITDFEAIPLHEVYENVKAKAQKMNVAVVGSQIVGAVPQQLFVQSADHFILHENSFILDEDQRIRLVIDRLGLNNLGLFNPKERIIEYILEVENSSAGGAASGEISAAQSLESALASMSLKEFTQSLSSRNSTPGSISVAAVLSSMATAIASMIGQMNYRGIGNAQFKAIDDQIKILLPPIYKAVRDFVPFIDRLALMIFEISKIEAIFVEETEEIQKKSELLEKSHLRYAASLKQFVGTFEKICPPFKQLFLMIKDAAAKKQQTTPVSATSDEKNETKSGSSGPEKSHKEMMADMELAARLMNVALSSVAGYAEQLKEKSDNTTSKCDETAATIMSSIAKLKASLDELPVTKSKVEAW